MYPSQHRAQGLPAAFTPLATITAIIGTIFIGPSVYPMIEPSVWAALSSRYEAQIAFWLAWAIKIGTYPLCYVLLRAVLLAALTAMMAFAARRML